MRGDAFTFADAENLLDYLDALGVSHLYLSPILTAAKGSTHGYDVTDTTTVSAELGGADGLARLSKAARSRGIGLIVDIVPNHVGVDDPQQNYGLLRSDLSEKPSLRALKNIIALLDDDGRRDFALDALDFNLTGDLNHVNHLLFQKP